MSNINAVDRIILQYFNDSKKKSTTDEISATIKIPWITVNNSLEKLKSLKNLKKTKEGPNFYWQLIE